MSHLQSGKAGTLPSASLMWGCCCLAVAASLLLELLRASWVSGAAEEFSVCSDRILTCRIKSIRSPAKVGLVVTDLITSPVVSWEGWETPPPQHRGSAVILCSTTGVGRPLSPVVTCCCRLLDFCLRLVDVDWNTVSFC